MKSNEIPLLREYIVKNLKDIRKIFISPVSKVNIKQPKGNLHMAI
jgi:hypothetical protein